MLFLVGPNKALCPYVLGPVVSEYRDFVKDDYVQSKQGNNEEVGIYENKAVARVIRICEPGLPNSPVRGMRNERTNEKEMVRSGKERVSKCI